MAEQIISAGGNQDVDLPGKMAAICWWKIAIAGVYVLVSPLLRPRLVGWQVTAPQGLPGLRGSGRAPADADSPCSFASRKHLQTGHSKKPESLCKGEETIAIYVWSKKT